MRKKRFGTYVDDQFPSFSTIWRYRPTLWSCNLCISSAFRDAMKITAVCARVSEAHNWDPFGGRGSASKTRQCTNSGRQPGEMWGSSSSEPPPGWRPPVILSRQPAAELASQGRIRGAVRAREGLEGLREMPLHGKRLRRMAFAPGLISPFSIQKRDPTTFADRVAIGQQAKHFLR